MITFKEYDSAIQIIADYKLQLDQQLTAADLVRNEKINIQQDIKENTFRVLQKYYQVHYVKRLSWADLKAMDRHLLETIDYDKMKLLKGYGHMSLFNLKKLMIAHAILDKEEL